MRQLLLLAGLALAGCGETLPPVYTPPVPQTEANGLPASFTQCVRRQAQTTAAIYDAFYPCERELVTHVARLSGMTQEAKATLLDDLEKRGMDYAQDTVTAVHGTAAVRRTVEPPPVQSVESPEDKARMRRWAECSVQTITTAHQQGLSSDVIIGWARSSCGHLWTGSPEGAERLYAKILASVRAGADPGYTVIEQKPQERNIRM
jgi:hypothetical protein